MKFTVFMILLTLCIGSVVKFTLALLGIVSWAYFVVLPALAVILYTTSKVLVHHYLCLSQGGVIWIVEQEGETSKRLSQFIPFWVAIIGLSALASLLAMLLPLIEWLFR